MAKAKKAPREAPAFNTLDDEEDVVVGKKPAGKGSAKKGDDDEEFFPDDDEAPKPVKGPNPKSKPQAKPPKAKAKVEEPDDSEDDDEDAPKVKSGKPSTTKPSPLVVRRTVNLQPDRKLTKKDQVRLEAWKGKERGKTRDAFFTRQAAEARKKFGHEGVYLGSQAETLVIGIPCPALSFEFVIGQDCFPLGLVMQIVAKHGVGKSGLLAEFGRWIDEAGGGTVLMENETKFNPHWYTSIMGKGVYDRMQLHRCKSVEDWQRHLTWSLKQMKADMEGSKEAPGPGRVFPVLFGVDSIMGKMSEENQEKILGKLGKKGKLGTTGDGFAQARSFPIEAGSITKYMRTVPQLMDRWPFALVLINHLRIKTDDQGNPERNKTGGEQVNFQESFELELKKIGGHAKKIQSANFEGVTLQLSCEKNSFGPTGRKAQTRMLWWYEKDEETGEQFQKTVWDWDWSTVHLLNTLLHGEGMSVYTKNRLKDIGFHIECPSVSDVENSAWSKTLGMDKGDAADWSTVGALIREDGKLMDNLRDALGITRRPLLQGDYLSQMEGIAEEMP